jgi:hypothetical protein
LTLGATAEAFRHAAGGEIGVVMVVKKSMKGTGEGGRAAGDETLNLT